MKARKKTKLVEGVGRNDADNPVGVFSTIKGKRKQVWACQFYETWKSMLTRCYSSKSLDKHNTYEGCSVVDEWHSFSAFKSWMECQDWIGGHLDKDILVPGNRVYGPGLCVFVSQTMNNFLLDRGSSRGDFPIGVYWHKGNGKFIARCCNPFSQAREHLGYFDAPESAHEAWRERKHQHACTYADQQNDPRIAAALRARYVNLSGEIQ